jgi:hypothetical protein
MSGTATDNDLRADVDVNVGFLFFRFSLKSTETTSIRGGKVILYRKTIDTGGDHKEITGELDGDTFTIVVRDGEKTERKGFSTMVYEATDMVVSCQLNKSLPCHFVSSYAVAYIPGHKQRRNLISDV